MSVDRLDVSRDRLEADVRRSRLRERAGALFMVLIFLMIAAGGLYGGLNGGGVGPWAAFAGALLGVTGYGWQALIVFDIVAPGRADSPTHTVTVTEDGVSCRSPRGAAESVSWSALQSVFLEAVDGGPAGRLFWRLVGDDGTGCDVPVEAAGSDELLESLQQRLPGFDNETVIAAMGMLDGVVRVWQRGVTSGLDGGPK